MNEPRAARTPLLHDVNGARIIMRSRTIAGQGCRGMLAGRPTDRPMAGGRNV
jgi:hypothetical protein